MMRPGVELLESRHACVTHRIPREVAAALTPSELAVARLIADSLSNEDIAQLRDTSSRTVANQIATLYRKLRVQSRRECVLRLYGGTLVPIDGDALIPVMSPAARRLRSLRPR